MKTLCGVVLMFVSFASTVTFAGGDQAQLEPPVRPLCTQGPAAPSQRHSWRARLASVRTALADHRRPGFVHDVQKVVVPFVQDMLVCLAAQEKSELYEIAYETWTVRLAERESRTLEGRRRSEVTERIQMISRDIAERRPRLGRLKAAAVSIRLNWCLGLAQMVMVASLTERPASHAPMSLPPIDMVDLEEGAHLLDRATEEKPFAVQDLNEASSNRLPQGKD